MVRFFGIFFLIFSSVFASAADAVFPGYFQVGNDDNAINPTYLLAESFFGLGSNYRPVYPIHFQLTEASQISSIELLNSQGLDAEALGVIWDENDNQLFFGQGSTNARGVIPANINLPAGDYQMAIWGKCFISFLTLDYCQLFEDWDDFSFDGVKLAGVNTDAVHFIERSHVSNKNKNGDPYDGSGLFPITRQNYPFEYRFTLAQDSTFNRFMLFNLRTSNQGVNAEVQLIEPNGSVVRLGFVSGNGDKVLTDATIVKTFAAGDYIIRIPAANVALSWDDFVVDFSSVSSNLPQCIDVFSEAIKGYVLNKPDEKITLPENTSTDTWNNNTPLPFSKGDHFFSGISLSAPYTGTMAGATARVNVKNGNIGDNSVINPNDPDRLILLVDGSITLLNGVQFNGMIYATGSVTVNPGAIVTGAITAEGAVVNYGSVTYDPEAVESADLSGLCENAGPPPVQTEFQYGQGELGYIEFDQPFSDIPVVFAMPTIDKNDPNADGPSTVEVLKGSVSATGFTVVQVEPSRGVGLSAKVMPKIDYVAVLPGKTQLPDGKEILAGVVETSAYQRGGRQLAGGEVVAFESGVFSATPSVLVQRYVESNNCWITATANDASNTQVELSLEFSEVYSSSNTNNGRRCYPGNVRVDRATPETLAWLAGEGVGEFTQNGETLYYEFGQGRNFAGGNTRDLANQCRYMSNSFLQSYGQAPIFVANKSSRDGSDGGWARRCDINATSYSIVVDEDQAQNAERNHLSESFDYFAITNNAPVNNEELEIVTEQDALTCDQHGITVRVLEDGVLDQDYTGLIRLSTDTGKGQWGLITGDGNLLPAPTSDDGVATYQFVSSDGGDVELSLFHQQAGEVVISVENADNTAAVATTVTFRPYGFKLSVPNQTEPASQYHYANRPFDAQLTAIGKDATTGQCGVILEYSGSKNIHFWSNYDAPTVVAGRQVEVNEQSIATTQAAASQQPIIFNAGISEPFKVNYPDAGRIELAASDNAEIGKPPGPDDDIYEGSQLFTFTPRQLVIDEVVGYRRDGSNEIQVSLGSGAFIRASQPANNLDFETQKDYDTFDIRVRAELDCSQDSQGHCSSSAIAPSFYHLLAFEQQLVAPGGGASGVMTREGSNARFNNYQMLSSEPGEVSLRHFAWNEVGTQALTASSDDYLNDSQSQTFTPIADATQTIGRFIPWYLHVDSFLATPSCQSFSYLDQQGVNIDLALGAYNQAPTPVLLSNYDTTLGYDTAAPSEQAWLMGAREGAGLLLQGDNSSRLLFNPADYDWQAGQLVWSSELAGLAKLLPHAVDGPFTSPMMVLNILGPDGERLQTSGSETCQPGNGALEHYCDAGSLGEMRYGRMVAANSHGSELASLRAPLRIEYFNGSRFETNTDDNCSALTYNPVANHSITEFSWAIDSTGDGNLDQAGETNPIPVSTGDSRYGLLNATAVAGEINLNFSAPGSVGGFKYYVDLNPDSGSNLCWLRFDWNNQSGIENVCGQGNASAICAQADLDLSPLARQDDCISGDIQFGLFRGNDRIIYRLEVND
ncbi:polymer-forming cytoskeletal protein [Motilimonas pumila]|uniref:DUF6701 domain-containing protein n=1 Tax=Motilimonas pumila TaxID=2303987 RepID=A0A418YI28_9GAMM|nr:hypothetical protein D1Z90_04890 [Motilimonas pumila]